MKYLKRFSAFVWRTIWGVLALTLLLLPVEAIVVYENKIDVKLPVDAVVTAVVTDWMYDHLPNLDDPPTEDFFTVADANANYWGFVSNSRWLQRRTVQILPYFVDNGITHSTRIPDVVAFAPYSEFDAFHLGGYAQCMLDTVILNIRYTDPNSPSHTSGDALGTLVHELGHEVGACGDAPDLESANEMDTWEVLASMVNHGDKTAIKPLMLSLRSGAMGYLRWWAINKNILPVYNFFEQNIIKTTPDERARIFAYWTDVPPDWSQIIDKYEAVPFQYMWEGLQDPKHWTRPLPTDADFDRLQTYAFMGGNGIVFATRPETVYRRIVVDDLNYVLTHIWDVFLVGMEK